MLNPTETTQANGSSMPKFQPMGFSEILDTTFSLYRKYVLLFLGIIGIHFLGNLAEYTLNAFLSHCPLYNLIASLASVPFEFVSIGGMIVASATIYLGRCITNSAALRHTLQRFFPMLGGYLIWLLLFSIPVISLSRLGRGMSPVSLSAMLLTCLPLPTYFLVRWLFVVEVVLLERLSVGPSLKRSRQLVRGAWWWIFSTSVSIFILSAAISIIFKVSVVYLLVFTKVAGETDFIGILRWALIENSIDSSNLLFYTIVTCTDLVVDTFTFPIWIIGNTLLYFDLRIRKEGFDLEIQVNNTTAMPTRIQ